MADTFARMRSLHGTTAEWAADDIVVGEGEIAIEVDGADVKFKVGDGLSTFSNLPYATGGATGNFLPLSGGTMDRLAAISFAHPGGPSVSTQTYDIDFVGYGIYGQQLEIKPSSPDGTTAVTFTANRSGVSHSLRWIGSHLIFPNPDQNSADAMLIGCDTLFGQNSLFFAHAEQDGMAGGAGSFVFQTDIPNNKYVSFSVDGNISITGTPTAANHVVDKQYVDDEIANVNAAAGTGLTQAVADARYLRLNGSSIMTGPVKFGSASDFQIYRDNTVLGDTLHIGQTGTSGTSGIALQASNAGAMHALKWTSSAHLVIPNQATTDFMMIGCGTLFGQNSLFFSHCDEKGLQLGPGGYVFFTDYAANEAIAFGSDGNISIPGTPSAANHALTRAFSDSRYARLNGATFTGPVIWNTAPTAAGHLANKQYVDNAISGINLPTSGLTEAVANGKYLRIDGANAINSAASIKFSGAGSRVGISAANSVFGDVLTLGHLGGASGAATVELMARHSGTNELHSLRWTNNATLVFPNPTNTDAMLIGCATIYGSNHLVFSHATNDGLMSGDGAYVFITNNSASTNFTIGRDGNGSTTAAAPTLPSHLTRKDYVDGKTWAASAITSGVLNIARIPTGSSSTTVALGNHNHTGVYAPATHSHTQYAVLGNTASFGALSSNNFTPNSPSNDLGINLNRWRNCFLQNQPNVSSDRSLKTDIEDIGFDLIDMLRPVQFRRLASHDKIEMGFIAQDVQAILGDDYSVVQMGDDGLYGMNHAELIAPLVAAVQKLAARVAQLEAK